MSGEAGERAAVEQDRPGAGIVEARDAVEERRLAGPVRPDQAADGAPRDLEGDILERGHAAEPDGEPADRKQGRGKQVYAFVRASGFRLGQLHGLSAPGVARPVKAAVDRSLDVSRRLVTCFVIRTLVDDKERRRLILGGRENRALRP